MAQVRVVFHDGKRDEIDVETEKTVRASVASGKVVVIGQRPGSESVTELGSYSVDDVREIVTTIWSSGDAE